MTGRETLLRLGVCSEAVAWIGERDPATAWAECPRGDWLLFFAERTGVDLRLLVRAGCACARRQAAAGTERDWHAEKPPRWAEDGRIVRS